MVIPAAKGRTARENATLGIRRLNPVRDLGQVADVIEEGFGPELTESGRRALREMRLLSYFRPLLWWLAISSPDFNAYHSGFVWVEGDQIVGTLHVTRSRSLSERWFISNVAVRTAYRGRGIARALMNAALDWARAQGGRVVFLRVRQANLPALSLYESLGFESLSHATDLALMRVPRVRAMAPDDEVALVPYHRSQWRQVRQLAQAEIPIDLRWLEPRRIGDFDPGLTRRLGDQWGALISGRRVERWVAQHEDRLIGTLVVKVAHRRGNHSLAFHVHPAYRGRVEQRLVTKALSRLWPHRRAKTTVSLPISYPQILETLKRHGFEESQTLTLMHRSLDDFDAKFKRIPHVSKRR